jgi:hypothetical protein
VERCVIEVAPARFARISRFPLSTIPLVRRRVRTAADGAPESKPKAYFRKAQPASKPVSLEEQAAMERAKGFFGSADE